MITGIDVVPGDANEAVRPAVVVAAEPTPRTPGAAIIGDGLYNNATTVAQVEEAQGRPCFSGLKAERVSDAFSHDAAADQMVEAKLDEQMNRHGLRDARATGASRR